MTSRIDWITTDIRYKPNNRGNKLYGTVVYNPSSRYCEENYHNYSKIIDGNFAYYQPNDVDVNDFPKNIINLMYNISGDQELSEKQTKIVQHRIYELYQKEVQRNEILWKLADKCLDKASINKDLLNLVGQSDIYIYTLRNVLDGFSEIARLKAQYDLIIKKIQTSNLNK